MRVVVQRSKHSSVFIDQQIVGQIDGGIVLLVGFTHEDDLNDIQKLAKKVVNLRIFDDENGVMNRSLLEAGGSILSISQFTLYGNADKGNRPSYVAAMDPRSAITLYDQFNQTLRDYGVKVETGVFGSEMEVSISNDGPVTILLESR